MGFIIGCLGDFLNLSPNNRHFLPLKSNIFIFSIDMHAERGYNAFI